MENRDFTQTIITKSERANRYEFGRAGNRFHLSFDTAEDLRAQIQALKTQGFFIDEELVNLSDVKGGED